MIGHLSELRLCLIRSLTAWIVTTFVSLFFSKEIFEILQAPMLKALPPGSRFIATDPMEPFVTYFKVSALAGLFLSSPVVLHQIWRFVSPGLNPREKSGTLLITLFSTLFFVGGASFGYFVIFPIGFRFFVGILAGTEIELLPQMRHYLGFITKMLLTFGVVFEVPLVLAVLGRFGIVDHEQLSRARRYVVVLSFLVAGFLTPGPDLLSQLLLGLPLLVLYEISILAVRLTRPQSTRGGSQRPSGANPRSPPESPLREPPPRGAA